MPEYAIPRGMRDIDPSEMAKHTWMRNGIQIMLRRYGFQLVEPTPLEHLETLEAKSGPSVRDEIYFFPDKGGRKLGLRFDLTVGMTRMVANSFDMPEPIRIAAVSDAWRYDEPQFAKYRHFYQWDAEIYGSPEQDADAEVISLGLDLLDSFGLRDSEARISNRRLVQGYLEASKITEQPQVEQALRVIDKKSGKTDGEMRKEFASAGLMPEQTEGILEFISLRGPPDKTLFKIEKFLKNEMMKKAYEELMRLANVLESLGKISRSLIDLSIVRGIGYYDGTVFEGYYRQGEDIGSLFGGGRFDKLCSLYGKRDMPATGVAGGIERLALALERAKLFPELRTAPRIFVIAVNDSMRPDAYKICQTLRDSGLEAVFDLKKRSMTKQLEYADAIGAPYALIIGPRELEKGMVRLRNMKTGDENDTRIEQIPKMVRDE